jgi:hypothetical protein
MMVSMPRPPLHKLPMGAFAAGTKAPQKAGENVASRRIALLRAQDVYPKFRRASDAQPIFFLRRHQPRRPPLAKIRPGNPDTTTGPGTEAGMLNRPAIIRCRSVRTKRVLCWLCYGHNSPCHRTRRFTDSCQYACCSCRVGRRRVY